MSTSVEPERGGFSDKEVLQEHESAHRALSRAYLWSSTQKVFLYIFLPCFRPLSYQYLLYLLVNLVVGWTLSFLLICLYSLGVSLIVLACIGLIILLGTLEMQNLAASFEVELANKLTPPKDSLARRIPLSSYKQGGLKARLKDLIGRRQVLIDAGYFLIGKFVWCTVAFFVGWILYLASLALLVAPIVYGACPQCMKTGNFCIGNGRKPERDDGKKWSQEGKCKGWRVNSIGDAFGLFFIGVPLYVISIHLVYWFGVWSTRFAKKTLAEEAVPIRENGEPEKSYTEPPSNDPYAKI